LTASWSPSCLQGEEKEEEEEEEEEEGKADAAAENRNTVAKLIQSQQ